MFFFGFGYLIAEYKAALLLVFLGVNWLILLSSLSDAQRSALGFATLLMTARF